MANLQRYAPRGVRRHDLDRWLRSIWPRRAEPSALPGVLASLALVLAGAAVALALTPMNGAEMRAMARKRLTALRRQTSDLVASYDPRAHNARGRESQSSRREATS